jgi:light-regulated signal transduction histidine kinase (bacteriophytochrome)
MTLAHAALWALGIGGLLIAMNGLGKQVRAREIADAALEKTVDELKRSNRELEQFAYVASHDLQEPLRQVRAYVGLIRERHGDKLDGKAGQYFEFVDQGAERMSGLVSGLLAYSRVGAPGTQREAVPSQQAVDAALGNLQAAIAESQAQVTCDELPTVMAEPTQLTQLFQNLIGNAIKFRREGVPPDIRVGGCPEGPIWLFWIKDNGIGIDPQYYEKIFLIFQRLHGRGQYAGTGIGLAICKKIVEQHGGRIWVESEPGGGSTFYFTLARDDSE